MSAEEQLEQLVKYLYEEPTTMSGHMSTLSKGFFFSVIRILRAILKELSELRDAK